MRNVVFVLAAALIFVLAAQDVFSQYWYSHNTEVSLKIDSSKVTLMLDPEIPILDLWPYLSQISRIQTQLDDDNMVEGFIVCSISTGTGYDQYLDSLREVSWILLAEPYYLDQYDQPFIVGDGICVAFRPATSPAEIDSLMSLYGAELGKEIMTNAYVVHNTAATGIGLLDLANALHQLPETEFAHPDFNVRPQLCAYKYYDYYANKQGHLKTVIGPYNGPTVWDFAGLTDTVMVAIVDDGIVDHEDLPRQRIEEDGWSGKYPAKQPGCWPLSAHGMGVAGIAAASHTTDSALAGDTTTGMLSINPHTRLMNIQLFEPNGFGQAPSDMAAGIGFAWRHGAEVMNNSWSYGPTSPVFDVVELALDSAFYQGRNGKGCVMVCASGNSGIVYPGVVSFPASHALTLAVGAVDLAGFELTYSQWGPELDLVAPSSEVCLQGNVWTLDQMYYSGYNPLVDSICWGTYPVSWNCSADGEDNNTNYDCHFGGTSAAAPIVTGIASLLLSRDSMLTAQEVYDIIKYSADPKISIYRDPIDPPDTLYGWGRADAFRAILSIARGDTDNSGWVDISDLNKLIDHLYLSLEPLFPSNLLGDCSCDGQVDATDVQVLIDHMFLTLEPLPLPCFEYGENY